MSKYTTEVRFICETEAGLTNSVGYSSVDSVLSKAVPKVFSFDFPIFDEKYRYVLCKKILKHYYTREICEETYALWKLRLDVRMNDIMPYYNQLYKSELIKFNPLHDIEFTRKGNRSNAGSDVETTNGSSTGTTLRSYGENTNASNNETNKDTGSVINDHDSTVTNSGTDTFNSTDKKDITKQETTSENKTSRDLYSDTPQGSLTNIENETYLTNARKITENNTANKNGSETVEATQSGTLEVNRIEIGTGKDTQTSSKTGEVSSNATKNISGNESGTSTSTTNGTLKKNAESTEDYIESITGKHGGLTYSKMLMEYRDTFLNIDAQIIEKLSDLFFGLW